MLLEDGSQLRHLAAEFLTVPRSLVELGQDLTHPLVVVDRISNQVFGLLVLPEDGEEMLFLELGQELEFLSEIGKQFLASGRALSDVSTSLANSSVALMGFV